MVEEYLLYAAQSLFMAERAHPRLMSKQNGSASQSCERLCARELAEVEVAGRGSARVR